jgi:hypothetical protein
VVLAYWLSVPVAILVPLRRGLRKGTQASERATAGSMPVKTVARTPV